MNKIPEYEMELVKELQVRISDLDLSQEYMAPKNLVRFIRARKEDLNQAEEMVRKNVEWYENNDIGSVLSYVPPPKFKDNFPWSLVGFDDAGGPLILLPMGRWNASAVSGHLDDFIRLCCQYFETAWSVMKLKGRGKPNIAQFTCIVDLEGLGWKHYTSYDLVQGVLTMVKYFEANYPDTLRLCVIVNAPAVFSLFWKLIKPIVSEATHAKLNFLGSDKKLWGNTISQYAHLDQFPSKYGGSQKEIRHISLDELGLNKQYITEPNGNESFGL